MPSHSDRLGDDDGIVVNGLLLVVVGCGVGLKSPVGLIDGALDEKTGIGAEVDDLGVGFGVRGRPDGVMVGSFRKLGDADGGEADDEGVGMTVDGPTKDGLGDVTGTEGPEVGEAIMVG